MMRRLDPAFVTQPLAHRGLHDRDAGIIENALSAIDGAIAAGFGIEIDVQLSAQNDAMVFHDYDLTRLAGRNDRVDALATDALEAVTLTGSHDRIPTLGTVLARVAGRTPLVIEIKDQDQTLGPNLGALEAAVAAALEGYAGPVAVMSFNPEAIKAFAALAPDIPRGLVTDAFRPQDWPGVPPLRLERLRQIDQAQTLDLDFISHNVADLDAAPVLALKTRDMPILCWTVRSAAQEAQARKIADNITFEGYTPTGHDAPKP